MEQLSFSKINIGLAILNKRDDGYHNIDTIFNPFTWETPFILPNIIRLFSPVPHRNYRST